MMETIRISFKDGVTETFPKRQVSQIFELIRNCLEICPNTEEIPLSDISKSEFVELFGMFHEALATNISIPFQYQSVYDIVLNPAQTRLADYLLAPETTTLLRIAARGDLERLMYAHEHGCPWDSWTCDIVAREGYLECLQYVHQQDCPWGPWTCEMAAEGGHLECLQYAHQQGCPWDEETCAKAA